VQHSFFVKPSKLGQTPSHVTYGETGDRFVHFSEPHEGTSDELKELVAAAISQETAEIKFDQLIQDWVDLIGEIAKEDKQFARLVEIERKRTQQTEAKGAGWKYLFGHRIARSLGISWYPSFVAS
jgi:hypothetical protein